MGKARPRRLNDKNGWQNDLGERAQEQLAVGIVFKMALRSLPPEVR